MAGKKTGKKSAVPSMEEDQTKMIPREAKSLSLLITALYLCASLALLGIGVRALITGNTLIEEVKPRVISPGLSEFLGSVLFSVILFSMALENYNPKLKKRVSAFLTAPVFLCAGLSLLVYDIYGLITNNLRLLFLSRFSSGGIFLNGPPVWVLFLAYLSFSVFIISFAASDLDKSGHETIYEKVMKTAPVLALVLYIGAVVLANKLHLHH